MKCRNCGHEEREPQRCPLGCFGLLSGAMRAQIPVKSELPGERGAIADLCDHLIQVHNAGPADAWWYAELAYPQTAREMGREAYEREGVPPHARPARYA